MSPTPRPVLAAAAATVFCVLALAGCSSGATPETGSSSAPHERLAGSMTELFQQQLQNPHLSDFERDVLERAVETGSIPQADYDEAFNRYEQCVSDLGYTDTWRKMPNGLYQITPPSFADNAESKKYGDQTADCADGTTMRIEAMFAQQQSNPDLNADPRAVVVQCLVAGGYVDASYTVDDLDLDLQAGFENAPYDVDSPDVNACFAGAGYAIAIQ